MASSARAGLAALLLVLLVSSATAARTLTDASERQLMAAGNEVQAAAVSLPLTVRRPACCFMHVHPYLATCCCSPAEAAG